MKKRLLILALALYSLFGLLIINFYRIEVVDEEKWSKLANRQHYFMLKEPSHRGLIYATSKERPGSKEMPLPLVVEIEKFHLFIDPESIPQKAKKGMITFLAEKLEFKDKKKLTSEFMKKTRSRKLKMWLEKGEKEEIIEWWQPYAKHYKIPYNALFFVTDYQRSYPFGKLLGQVLHTTQTMKDEKDGRSIPTGGLELYFNDLLEGVEGKRRLMRSPRNHLETGEVIKEPETGADIYLTIDPTLQAIAEEEILKGVKKCKAKAGWAVMMDPFTGEVLAMAQAPFFEPSDYSKYFTDPLLTDRVRVKAITDANEPGSVIKPINIALALKANDILKAKGEKLLFSPDEKIDTSNGYFKGRGKSITDTHFHHFLNMDMGIQKSSNVYIAKIIDRIVNRLGVNWYRSELIDTFGLGIKTGIELPGETRGKLPLPGKKHPNGALEWSLGTHPSLAMGYNLQLNSLQILRAHAVLATKGYLVKPTLIKKIVKGNEVLYTHIPIRQKVLSSDIAERVVEAMKYTTKPGGTARRGDIWGYTEAGKTSTSHKLENGVYSEKKYIANFIGFTPVNQPKIILIVTMDEAEYGYIPGVGKNHHGGNACAPVFREISKKALEYLGVEPDDPYGYPQQDPRFNLEKADMMLKARKLQENYESWNKSTK